MGIGMLFGEIRVAESLALVVKPESSLMREREREDLGIFMNVERMITNP